MICIVESFAEMEEIEDIIADLDVKAKTVSTWTMGNRENDLGDLPWL
jgi:hypothetical protein